MKRIITLLFMALMLVLSLCLVIVSPGKPAFVAGAPTTTVSSPTTSTTTRTTTTTPPTTSTTSKTTTTTTTTTAGVDHYAVTAISAPQAAGTAFNVTIQAQDNKNTNLTTGSETINVSFYLKDTGATPVSVVTVNGRATVNMNMTLAQTGQQIVFTGAASGKIGKSDIFTVQANPTIDHYAVSGPATPQTAGTGFNVTIQAQDTYGNNINTGSETVKVDLAKTDKGATPDSTTIKNGTSTFDMDLTVAQTGQQIICTGGASKETGASGTFTVNPGALTAIAVSPSTKTLDIKATQQFTATGLDSCGNEVHCTPVWSVTDMDAGIIDPAGLFTAGTKAGTYTNTIAATSGAISGYASVTVNQTSFPITVTQSGNGTIVPGTTNVNYGGSQTFIITPATGYHIIDVQVDGAPVGAVSRYSFNNITTAHNITAGFAINTYSVSFVAGAHGIITGGTTVQTINYGANATEPTITANTGWTFSGWDTTFTNVTANLTVTAQYSQITYTVSFSAGAHGLVTGGTTVQTIPYGGNAAAPTITANPGWTFTGWDTTFTNVTANLTVTAQYSQITYTVSFVAGAHGLITGGTATQTIPYGGNAAAPTITANPGWTFTGWDTTFTNVTANLTVTAQYSQITYTVSFAAGTHGLITGGAATQTIPYGGNAAAPTITANPGWTFTGWDTTFTNVTANLTVTAQYSQITYTVSFVAGAHGLITGGTAVQTIPYGGNAAAPTITANSGWTFTGWDTTFTNVTANLTVTAQYSQITYTVTFSAGTHGLITGGTAVQTINYGANAAAPTITANPGWTFTGWDMTFTNVTANLTVTAQYSQIIYTVTFSAGTHGLITSGTAVQTIPYGGNAAAPTITANSGWTFTGWDTTFTNVTANLTVTAQYSQITYTVTFSAGTHGALLHGNNIQPINFGGTAVAPIVTADQGWKFTGWDRPLTNITAYTVITAQYSQIQYTVSFVVGDHGNLDNGNAVQAVTFGAAADAPVVSPNSGWVFTGWDSSFNNITGDITVTAQYRQVVYTVHFNLGNYGKVTGGFVEQFVDGGQVAMAPEVTAEPGWVFTGWDTSFTDINEGMTITAQYEQVKSDLLEPEVVSGAPFIQTQIPLTPNNIEQQGTTAAAITDIEITTTEVNRQAGSITGEPNLSLIAGIIIYSVCCCLVFTLFIVRLRSKRS